jgi:outer membrane protein assembly factor BamB
MSRARMINHAKILTVALFFSSAAFSQTITLSPTGGPPTTSTQVSGSGFSPGASFSIYFDATDLALATADGSGSFSDIAIQVSASALPGKHTVSAVPSGGGSSAQATFTVYTEWRQSGFEPGRTSSNAYENVLSPSTVGVLELKWSFTTGGTVNSSPAVVNGVVYFGSGDSNVYALDASTGGKLWSYTTGGPLSSSPAVVAGVLCAGSNAFYALDASTGAELWSNPTGGASSPVVVNGAVYFSTVVSIYALDASTGAQLWIYSIPPYEFLYCGGSIAVAYGTVYAGCPSQSLTAIDASTGAALWGLNAGSNFAVVGGVIYDGQSGNKIYALNASTGAGIWSHFVGYGTGQPAVGNEVVYVGIPISPGGLFAIKASTGTLLWSENGENGLVSSAPALANGVL